MRLRNDDRTAAYLLLACFLFPVVSLGQEGAGSTAEPAAAPATEEVDAGATAWVMTSSALVMMMTLPGLALFYGGLVRKKNILSVMMQCTFLAGLMSVVWALWGYSLAFGGSGGFIGNRKQASSR